MKRKRIIILIFLLIASFAIFKLSKKFNINPNHKVGEALDSLNGVVVYFNGGVDNSEGRNTSEDNYNIGIKYQCVEFVKRYYYERLNHKMPDAFGNAKDFFNEDLADGALNEKRDLIQFTNGSKSKPLPDDLLIFSSTFFNKYGHVAIVSMVTDTTIEIIQQNPGPFGNSRDHFKLSKENEKWRIDEDRILGWLRKEK
ncbi:MAG: CHAP domain-containing protein [Bacteroidia bacterium]|nr:CHAP domain-containing protein [Bacteroidia bacterium]